MYQLAVDMTLHIGTKKETQFGKCSILRGVLISTPDYIDHISENRVRILLSDI